MLLRYVKMDGYFKSVLYNGVRIIINNAFIIKIVITSRNESSKVMLVQVMK